MTELRAFDPEAVPPSRPQSRYWLTLSALVLLLLPVLVLVSIWLAQPSYDPARRVPAAESELVPAAEAWLAQHRPALTAQWQVCRDGWLPCRGVRDDYFAAVSAPTHSDFGIIEPHGPTEVERLNPVTGFYLLTILTAWIGGLVARELSPKRRQAERVAGAAEAAARAEQDAALSWSGVLRPNCVTPLAGEVAAVQRRWTGSPARSGWRQPTPRRLTGIAYAAKSSSSLAAYRARLSDPAWEPS